MQIFQNSSGAKSVEILYMYSFIALNFMGVRYVLKVSKLNNRVKESAYQESMHGKYEVRRGGEVESVEEWEKFRDIVMECANDVCGMRRVGRLRRNGREYWNEELGRAAAENRRAFEEWIQRRDMVTYDRYRGKESGCETGSPSCKKKG